jgi:hypothetical protein
MLSTAMMQRAGLVVVIGLLQIACDHSAASPPDAMADASTFHPGPDLCMVVIEVDCHDSVASLTTIAYPHDPSFSCSLPHETTTQASCASGCSVTGSESYSPLGHRSNVVYPSSLCSETADAQIGQSCAGGCIPTHATIRDDGTVVGQSYLGCDSMAFTCIAVGPPVIPNYLGACDPTIVAAHDEPGVNGVIASPYNSCLIAWDDVALSATSGVTSMCIGDWECPDGSLCDDQMTLLSSSTLPPAAVCKPGPRGTLTPAMLTP